MYHQNNLSSFWLNAGVRRMVSFLIPATSLLLTSCLYKDGDIDSLPSRQILNGLEIMDDTYSPRYLFGTAENSEEIIDIDWRGSLLIFPQPDPPLKLTINIDPVHNRIVSVSLKEDQDLSYDEYYTYSETGVLTEVRRLYPEYDVEYRATFFSLSSLHDSIALRVSAPGLQTKVGFMRRVNNDTYMSIYPYNAALDYSLEDTDFDGQGPITALPNINYFNTWRHTIPQGPINVLGLQRYNTGKVSTVSRVNFIETGWTQIPTSYQLSLPTEYSGTFGDRTVILDKENFTVEAEEIIVGHCTSYYLLLSGYFEEALLLNEIFGRFDSFRRREEAEDMRYVMKFDYSWVP